MRLRIEHHGPITALFWLLEPSGLTTRLPTPAPRADFFYRHASDMAVRQQTTGAHCLA